jgi:ribosomal protein S18 acetylase RimI-like enzyme
VIRDPRPGTSSIVPFRPELAPAFTELNRAWIERLFVLEEADWKVLRDPEESIMRPGGQIFFAMDGAQAVGTAAAIRVSAQAFELGKMAVSPCCQGRGLGERLGRAVIDHARSAGAETIYLETNSRLANAIRLYQRLGFRKADFPVQSDYARADVYMELRLRAEG